MNKDNVIDIFDLGLLKHRMLYPPEEPATEPATQPPTQPPTQKPTEAPTQPAPQRKQGVYYNLTDVSKIDPSKPMVAFAFDDGPIGNGGENNSVKRIQDAVAATGGSATFFYWGERIAGNEQEIKRAQSLGFEIANHTWTHNDMRNMDGNGIKNEIGKCADKLKEITGGQDDFLVRPPYLGVNATVQQNCGCALVNCGIDSGDWNHASANDIYNKFMQAAGNGSLNGKVLLMHENYGSTADAVEKLCKDLPAQGYQIVSVGQMFKAKGVDMQYGTVYNQLP
jgi:peptidoglycan/xylan/chitin deacetylase (PgdA/CDA1 family)